MKTRPADSRYERGSVGGQVSRLDDEWLDDYQSTAEHGEWGVAFENLCEQLFEFDILLNEQEFQSICEIGESMKIDPQRWNFLAPQKS